MPSQLLPRSIQKKLGLQWSSRVAEMLRPLHDEQGQSGQTGTGLPSLSNTSPTTFLEQDLLEMRPTAKHTRVVPFGLVETLQLMGRYLQLFCICSANNAMQI